MCEPGQHKHKSVFLFLVLTLVLASSWFTLGLCSCLRLCLRRPGSHVAYACARAYACACIVPVHTWLMLVLTLVLASSQFTHGLCLCLCLCVCIIRVPALCGFSTDPLIVWLVYSCLMGCKNLLMGQFSFPTSAAVNFLLGPPNTSNFAVAILSRLISSLFLWRKKRKNKDLSTSTLLTSAVWK